MAFWQRRKEWGLVPGSVTLEYRINTLELKCNRLEQELQRLRETCVIKVVPKESLYSQPYTLPWAGATLFLGTPMPTKEGAQHRPNCGIREEAMFYGEPVLIKLGK